MTKLSTIYKHHLRKKKLRLLRKFMDIHLQLNGFPREYELYYSNIHKVKDKKMTLGEAESPGRRMILYINNINRMFDNRLNRIILHEIAHLQGADEKQAVKAEPKEPKYE